MKRILTVGLLAAITVVSVGSVEADMFVYPKKGQNKEQQQKDQYECHLWAVDQTGVDPMKPAQPAQATAQSGGGEVVHGAAKGAALGAIGGGDRRRCRQGCSRRGSGRRRCRSDEATRPSGAAATGSTTNRSEAAD